jgi:hypothetical protein
MRTLNLVIGISIFIILILLVVFLIFIFKKSPKTALNIKQIIPVITTPPSCTLTFPYIAVSENNKPLSSDYQLFDISANNNKKIQDITFVPEINQYVFMTITGSNSNSNSYLVMVSQDNSQARFIKANDNDVASQIFNPSKWNNGYTIADGKYYVIKPSDYELYGEGIGGISRNVTLTVQYVVYDPDAAQPVFMAIENGYLKMVSQDNLQVRNIATNVPNDPSKVYEYGRWSAKETLTPNQKLYNVGSKGKYIVRKK